VTSDAAALAIAVSLALGYYFARWRKAERGLQGAKKDVAKATRNVWPARVVMVIVAIIGALVLRAWLQGHGR
jgi:hypothetical protein